MTGVTIDKRKMMNQYNNKIVLQRVLEMLGISRECTENDLVLKIIISLFRNKIELFDFSETDYFNGYEDREEILKSLLNIEIRKIHETLEDKLLVEESDNFCIIRVGKIVDRNGYDHDINHLELYKKMILDMNNSLIKKFLATELYYDKNNKVVFFRNQEIVPFQYEKKEGKQEIFASVTTVAEEYDERKKWKKSVIQNYNGQVENSGIHFFDSFSYQSETTISICENKVSVSYKLLDEKTHKKVTEENSAFDLKYKKVYDDYITGKIFALGEEGNITSNLTNLLDGMTEIPSDYEKCIGICYCLDDDLQEDIKLEQCMNDIKNLSSNDKRKKR